MLLQKLLPFSFFSSTPSTIGIEIDSQYIRLAKIRIKKGKIKVELLRELPFNESKKLLEGISKSCWYSVLLPQRKVMVRTITIKSNKIKDALQALEFELEPKLPFPIQNAIFQGKAEKIQKNEIEVTTYICEKETIKNFLINLKSQSLPADRLTCAADSIAQLFCYDPEQKDKENIFISIGTEETSVVLTKNGRVLAQQSFLTEDKQLPFSIQRTVLNFSSRGQKNFSHVYLFGKKAHLFSSMIHDVTKKNIHTLSLFDSLSEKEWRTFAPVIGAALSDTKDTINFRKNEFSLKFPFKRELKPALLSLVLSIFCAGSFFFSQSILDRKKSAIYQKDLSAIYSFLNHNNLEAEHLKTPYEFVQLSNRIFQELNEKNFESKKPPFLISEILQDFSQKIAKADSPLNGARILDFQWEIKKRATPSSPRIPYQIEGKLVLELLTPNGKESVSKLLSESTFIDQKQEVFLSAQDNIVTAQFFFSGVHE